MLKLVTRLIKAPLYKAWKKWNWQKLYIKKCLTDLRDNVREKYVEPTKERQVSIAERKSTI